MATNQATRLALLPRDTTGGSRATRRLRRSGQVPGVLYGGDGEPVSFAVDARVLRHALAAKGAVLELDVDGATTPAVLKDTQRHPVRGETMHVDFIRVNLSVAIHATVPIELIGGDDAPGVKSGGVLDQVTREVNVEALPNEIPETIQHDVSAMEIGDTLLLSSISAPKGVTLLDDLEGTVVASLAPPTIDAEAEDAAAEDIETETEVVGEGDSGADAEGGDDADASGDDAAE